MKRLSVMQRVLAGVLGALLLAVPGRAQDAASPALDVGFNQGLQALDAGRIDAAIDLLEGVFEENPAYVFLGKGGAAYWLGRAYQADDDPESTREVWKEGLEALDEASLFDPRLADAFARMTFAERHGTDYPLAARAYLHLLESLDGYPYLDEEADLARAHLAALRIILPEDVQKQTGLDGFEWEGLEALAEGAGARLVAWWRSRDVAPATRNNERLEEHLTRTLYAEQHYRYRGDFDDRGRVYIQLGAPSHVTDVPFDNISFRNKVVDRSLTLHLSDFPENEFWVYEHIDQAAQFLFYTNGGPYRLGEVRDLLPSVLRNGLGSSERGKSKARALIHTLEEIYRQLSLYHPNFASIYQDVAIFAGLLDEAEYAAEASAMRPSNQQSIDQGGGDEGTPEAVRDALASGAGIHASMPGATLNPDRPDLFAQRILSQAHIEDEQALLQREDYVPRSYSNAFDDAEPLPTVTRLARFLDDDGATRTEIYWGVPPGALQPSKRMIGVIQKEGYQAKDYLLMTTVVQKTDAYQERVVNYRRHLLRDLADARDAALEPQMYVVRGDTGLFHLALQWDQYTTTLGEDGQPVVLGLRVKAHTFRSDSLQALDNDERVLEMSDLKPMVVLAPDQAVQAGDVLDAATLYPFDTLEKQTPLLLYFEVYHLAFGPDDQTHYTVAYEVRRKQGRRGLLRFLGGPKEEGTAAQTDYTGASRTARESILLDFAQWEGRGALEITVRVTDRVTGRQVERMIPMRLVKER